jgi:glutathione synthase
MYGKPLERQGKYAALRRVPAKGEVRSNIHVAGTPEPVEISEKMLAVAEMVRPKLIQDGMFFVGLDIVGDKILEINVFTPGGLWSISQMYKTDFAETVILALENKVSMRAAYPAGLSNRQLATL